MAYETILILGGGLAGLSSAVALSDAGYRVCLLERRPHLGGRAASYILPDGSHIDNCQHVTLGCCTNLADFYRRVGAGDQVRFYDQITFAAPAGRRARMCSSFLPAPFHLTASFMRFGLLGLADKVAIGRALLHIARHAGHPPDAKGRSMLEWLRLLGQTPRAMDRFWSTVLVSALDEELARTSAQYGIDVFWKAFLKNRKGYLFGIPKIPLGDLYSGCRAAVEIRGGEVRTRAGIREMRVEDGRVSSLLLDDGSELRPSACISALPHDALLQILPPAFVTSSPNLIGLRNLEYSPITGVHLWFDRPVMDEPFLALLDRTVQWVFNKTLLRSQATSQNSLLAESPAKEHYLQLVISASRGLISLSRQEILDLCRGELADILPVTRTATLLKGTVVKEVSAAFSPAPGADRWRIGPESPLGNLWLAGDWTPTGWPATMEGAVRSGYRAAEVVLAAAGSPRRFLKDDLPAQGFARWWASGVAT
jgi:squalene-associated FAD-dependent desaturase